MSGADVTPRDVADAIVVEVADTLIGIDKSADDRRRWRVCLVSYPDSQDAQGMAGFGARRASLDANDHRLFGRQRFDANVLEAGLTHPTDAVRACEVEATLGHD